MRSKTAKAACESGNVKAGEAAATLYGCKSGVFFEGSTALRVITRRTPGPEAGCNKPAASKRRKPSERCETVRTEQEIQGQQPESRR